MPDYARNRFHMIEGQLRPNHVTSEALLAAFRHIPREAFVPEHLQAVAYVDSSLPLGDGRYLMPPLSLARLLQEAQVQPDDRVLDLGCATGYATAILARIAHSVTGVDSNAELIAQAAQQLTEQRTPHAMVIHTSSLAQGYPQRAPYNVILINGAVADVPTALTDQLHPQQGRLVTVIRQPDERIGVAWLLIRQDDHISKRPLFDTMIPMLTELSSDSAFVF